MHYSTSVWTFKQYTCTVSLLQSCQLHAILSKYPTRPIAPVNIQATCRQHLLQSIVTWLANHLSLANPLLPADLFLLLGQGVLLWSPTQQSEAQFTWVPSLTTGSSLALAAFIWHTLAGPAIRKCSQVHAAALHTHRPAGVHAQRLSTCDANGGDHLLYPQFNLNGDIPVSSTLLHHGMMSISVLVLLYGWG